MEMTSSFMSMFISKCVVVRVAWVGNIGDGMVQGGLAELVNLIRQARPALNTYLHD